MREPEGLGCPQCGARMNRHAEKMDYRGLDAQPDGALGGVLAEFHTCTNPACGFIVERPARDS
jgi:hypothetical protein